MTDDVIGCYAIITQNVEVSNNSKTSEMVLCGSDFIEIVLSVEDRTYILCYSMPTKFVGADLGELNQTKQKWKIWL